MNDLIKITQNFYSGDLSNIYEHARYISCEGNPSHLSAFALARGAVNASIVRSDQMSDCLGYIQAEYRDAVGYHTEIVGAIKVNDQWTIMCVTAAISKYRFGCLYKDNIVKQLDDLGEISALLLRYCHDVYIMDANDCLELFSQDTRMYHPNGDGSFTDVEIQVLHQRWNNMPDPVSLGIKEFSRIYHIEMLDNNTAIAKIGCAKLDSYFNDYLSLLRLDGSWKIVNKMTHTLYVGEQV